MATKLKDIPFETLVPVMAPVNSVIKWDSSDENALLIDTPFVLARGCDGASYDYVMRYDDYYGWMFLGIASFAEETSHASCADGAGYADYAGHADYADCAYEADYASCASDAYLACIADFACEADRAGLANYAECAGSAAGADYANHANTTDQLGVSGANMYACGGELRVGGIDGHYGRLAVMSVSDLQGASPCTYVLVVEG